MIIFTCSSMVPVSELLQQKRSTIPHLSVFSGRLVRGSHPLPKIRAWRFIKSPCSSLNGLVVKTAYRLQPPENMYQLSSSIQPPELSQSKLLATEPAPLDIWIFEGYICVADIDNKDLPQGRHSPQRLSEACWFLPRSHLAADRRSPQILRPSVK